MTTSKIGIASFSVGSCGSRNGQSPDHCFRFVAFGLSRDAEQECAAYHNRTLRIIELPAVREGLDEARVPQT